MSILIAARHARSTANRDGILAGRMPGVDLDEHGREQAAQLGRRLAEVPLDLVLCSPVQRCQQTLEIALEASGRSQVEVRIDERLAETDYGTWTGRALADLATEPEWQTVQHHPELARFPDGESMLGVRQRVLQAVCQTNAELGEQAVWMTMSHGDPTAALLNWVVGADFTQVQRVGVGPASASIVLLDPRITPDAATDEVPAPRLVAMNTQHGPVSEFLAQGSKPQVGGSSGT